MLLHNQTTGSLVKVVHIEELLDPNQKQITAKSQRGQAEQPAESFPKQNLLFPSGEKLPLCWTDANYQRP